MIVIKLDATQFARIQDSNVLLARRHRRLDRQLKDYLHCSRSSLRDDSFRRRNRGKSFSVYSFAAPAALRLSIRFRKYSRQLLGNSSVAIARLIKSTFSLSLLYSRVTSTTLTPETFFTINSNSSPAPTSPSCRTEK